MEQEILENRRWTAKRKAALVLDILIRYNKFRKLNFK